LSITTLHSTWKKPTNFPSLLKKIKEDKRKEVRIWQGRRDEFSHVAEEAQQKGPAVLTKT
jgi:hypothetical protein